MRLNHLSIASIVACLLGLVALMLLALYMSGDIRQQQEQLRGLLLLDQRASALSVASNHLLLHQPDEELRQAFITEARDVQSAFQALEDVSPGAGKVGRHIDLMLDMLAVEHDRASAGSGENAAPVAVSQRGRIIMGQMAGHGAALEAALISLLHQRERDIARQTNRAVAVFSLAALLFGALCVLSFLLIHRQLAGPVQQMSRVITRLSRGDDAARVRLRGDNELTELGESFNRLLDQQQQSESELRSYEQELKARARALAESQRIARVGSFRFDMATQMLYWSEETCRIIGVPVEEFRGTVGELLERIHPDDRDRFLASREKALRGEETLDIEYRVIRPDGEVRIVHQRAELERSGQGQAEALVGTVQDISEQRAASERIQHQQQLLDTAGRIARVGGWSIDPATETIEWSRVVCDIHEVAEGSISTLAQAVSFYIEESRERIRQLYEDCVRNGTSFDEELQLLTANGRHVWVRVAGEAVHDRVGTLVRVQGTMQDITARKQSEEKAQRMAQRLSHTLDHIGEGFFTLDAEWRFTYVNAEALRTMRLGDDQPLGEAIWEYFPDLKTSPVGSAYRKVLKDGRPANVMDFHYPPLDAWFDIRIYPTDGGLAVFFSDASERRAMIRQLREQESAIRQSRDELASVLRTRQTLINSLPAHIALVASDGEILDVNEHWHGFVAEQAAPENQLQVGGNYLAACKSVSGEGAEYIRKIATGLGQVLAGQRSGFSLEYPAHGGTEQRWYRVSINQLSGSGNSVAEPGAVVMHVDITERKQAENELNRLAFEDGLTHVLSRTGFTRTLAGQVDQGGWDSQGMVVMLDLINLRHVNDAHGYAVGDELLKQVGSRLARCAGRGSLVGRAGGDEFMVYLSSDDDKAKALRRKSLSAAFQQPFEVDGFPIEIVARFGYTQLRDRQRPVEQLLREAELALFQGAGREGRNHWSSYTARLDKETRERVELTHELRQALERDEFELHFQPKVDMNTGKVVAAEALIRWHHPRRGMVSPAVFIPVAEQSQLIGPLGDWVLTAACQTLAEWQQADLDIVRIAVNVSLNQFAVGDFTQTVKRVLRNTGVVPNALSLEITESVFEHEADGLQAHLARLHEAGIRLSLDDFGTGYSSLLYLQKYPFDEIKIDQGFVSGMVKNHYSREIVKTVIGMAGVIGAEAVAEGVETVEDRDALLKMGCHIAQGYYFSKPLPKDQFRVLLERNTPLPVGK